ncbi:hypothetical protein [Duganella sp. Root1480D1]|uniref:hypothetical protein n=1 Tax=Duganella sp. Root1480D1 TaxID=1736471 RepID=UPI0007128E8A|nr:hypothetical protein [Duganella sp. Root1480D1]KQZ44735.1 hypothetical protein ASD58_00245 [Duganella sp. Root1480D1]
MAQGEFLDWWFNPSMRSENASPLSRRLAYRLWCAEQGVRPDFPRAFDSGWQQFAGCDAQALLPAARLYGALLAVREGRHGALASLPSGERRWSLATAAIQPLVRLCRPSGDLQCDGLRELACAMEAGFPGMWDRLRLVLPGESAADAGAVLTGFMLRGLVNGAASGAAARRRLRCWGLCLEQADRVRSQGEWQ